MLVEGAVLLGETHSLHFGLLLRLSLFLTIKRWRWFFSICIGNWNHLHDLLVEERRVFSLSDKARK